MQAFFKTVLLTIYLHAVITLHVFLMLFLFFFFFMKHRYFEQCLLYLASISRFVQLEYVTCFINIYSLVQSLEEDAIMKIIVKTKASVMIIMELQMSVNTSIIKYTKNIMNLIYKLVCNK